VAYGFNKVDKALEIIEEIKAAGEKVIVFTSLRGLYRTLEAAFTDRCIAYVGMDGVGTGSATTWSAASRRRTPRCCWPGPGRSTGA
jgi:hypothetical protein